MAEQGKTIVIAGAAGEVGEPVTAAFLRAGYRVIATSRDPQRLEGLQARVGGGEQLLTAAGAFDSEETAAALMAQLRGLTPKIDGVIASLGGWKQGTPLVETSLAEWNRILAQNLTTHFLAARAFLPWLAESAGSFYFALGGGAAIHPVATAGPVCSAGAAQMMLTRILAMEMKEAVRIHEVILYTPIVTRSRPASSPWWLTGEEVAAYLLRLAVQPADNAQPLIHLKTREDL